MTQIALASGFGCVPRFNAAIQSTYHRTPTRLRQLARHMSPGNPNEYTFRLNYRPPYAWDTLLRFLALRATPGVEHVEANCYRRTIELDGFHGSFTVCPHEKDKDALSLRLQFGEPKLLFNVVERVRNMFGLNADWQLIAERLRHSPQVADTLRAALAAANGGSVRLLEQQAWRTWRAYAAMYLWSKGRIAHASI